MPLVFSRMDNSENGLNEYDWFKGILSSHRKEQCGLQMSMGKVVGKHFTYFCYNDEKC